MKIENLRYENRKFSKNAEFTFSLKALLKTLYYMIKYTCVVMYMYAACMHTLCLYICGYAYIQYAYSQYW